MEKESLQPELKKRSKRLILVLVAAVLLIAVIFGSVVFKLPNIGQSSYGPGPIDLEVTTEKPFYLLGEEVYFVIYVNNSQDWPVAHPDFVEHKIEKDGILIDATSVCIDFAVGNIPTFPAHSRTLYSPLLLWNQKTDLNGTRVQAQPGNYILTVKIQGFGYSNRGNYTFEIR